MKAKEEEEPHGEDVKAHRHILVLVKMLQWSLHCQHCQLVQTLSFATSPLMSSLRSLTMQCDGCHEGQRLLMIAISHCRWQHLLMNNGWNCDATTVRVAKMSMRSRHAQYHEVQGHRRNYIDKD